MATTTNYSWTTPDDTALVKDGAAAIRSLGTSIDTTTKNLNPSTTLGDIEYRSSTANTNTRLAIGSNGNVLTVSGGVPTWAAPSSAGANYTLLNAGGTSLSGSSTVTVSGISGKEKILMRIVGASVGGGGYELYFRINGDSGSNYIWNGNTIQPTSSYSANMARNYSGTGTEFPFGAMASTAASVVDAGILIDGGTATGGKSINLAGGASSSSSDNQANYNLIGFYNGSAAITSVSLFSFVNFDAGTLFVYGA